MKVGIVTPYFYPVLGGVQEHVFNLHRQLRMQGHQVKIITSNFGGRADIESLPEKDLVRIGRAVAIPMNRSISQVALPYRLGPKVKQLLEREDFDILHVHEPLAPTLPLAVLRHSTTANMGTFHAYSSSSLGYPFARSFLLKYFRRLHGRIFVSQASKEFISRYFKGDCRIIPNGVDVHRFSPEVPPIGKYRDGKVNLLFVGQLVPKKGLIHLLRALRILRPRFSDLRLLVVGRGPLERCYKRWACRHIGDGVHFEGAQHKLLPSYYATCDIFCAPSPAGAESFGIVLLEAMASGKPVVASNILGYNEVLTHGGGLLFQPGDPEDLARAIHALLLNPSLRQSMGREGRRIALDYSWEHISRSVLDYYSEVMEEVKVRARRR